MLCLVVIRYNFVNLYVLYRTTGDKRFFYYMCAIFYATSKWGYFFIIAGLIRVLLNVVVVGIVGMMLCNCLILKRSRSAKDYCRYSCPYLS